MPEPTGPLATTPFPDTLTIRNPRYFFETLLFAASVNCLDHLIRQFSYALGDGDKDRAASLYPDFAPHSFIFSSFISIGGIIYSGPGQPLDGSAPALTVSLSPSTATHSWCVHT